MVTLLDGIGNVCSRITNFTFYTFDSQSSFLRLIFFFKLNKRSPPEDKMRPCSELK